MVMQMKYFKFMFIIALFMFLSVSINGENTSDIQENIISTELHVKTGCFVLLYTTDDNSTVNPLSLWLGICFRVVPQAENKNKIKIDTIATNDFLK